MKAKLAIGLVLILVLQISSSMPDVDQLEEPVTENKSQINSPQGVNSTVFMPVSGPRMDFYYSDGRTMTFGDDLLVAYDNHEYTNPKFGGNTICTGSGTHNSQCGEQTLFIINYTANSLEGIISLHHYNAQYNSGGAFEPILFDTANDTLHLMYASAYITGENWYNVEWPIGSSVRNYSAGLIIFDSSGSLISNNVNIQNGPRHSNGTYDATLWPGYFSPYTAGSTDNSHWECRPGNIIAHNETDSTLFRSCGFRGSAGGFRVFNLTGVSGNTTSFQLNYSSQKMSLLLIQRYSSNSTLWSNAKTYYKPTSQYGPFERCSHFADLDRMSGSISDNDGLIIASMVGFDGGNNFGNSGSDDCTGIGDLNGENITEIYSVWNSADRTNTWTYAINSSNGESLWISSTGMQTSANKQTITNGDYVYICGISNNGYGYVNSTSINIGSMGIIILNRADGSYHNHFAASGSTSNTYPGCTSMFTSGGDVYITMKFISYSGNNQLSKSVGKITVIRLDNQSNMDLVYSLTSGSTQWNGGIFERVTDPVLIVQDPNSISYGSGTMAGGEGFGAFFLEDDYDQDNQADNTDPDDDNDGYLDVNDNCPRGMMDWTPGSSTDADSDGCHFSEDLDNDNDGVDDSLDNCDSPANSFTSTPITDYDGDGCRDSTEDDDDDNDNILDVNDNCIKSVNNSDVLTNDTDSDGCGDSVEDYDDDNDGVFDVNDQCQTYPNTWQSSSNTDHDSDGCKDSLEDNDDDNDGINDNLDSCSTGKIGWIPTTENDGDSDGCYDANEDIDDDNDGVTDSADACPKQAGDSSFGSLLGCPDTDQDGYGDNIDSCQSEYGTSFRDVYGCPDSDGDGYSDSGDDFPNDASAHSDSDSDGVEDSIDEFPFLPGQWLDNDGDGYGDNPTGPTPDSCVETYGNSTRDIYGCLDSDGDGYSDINDKFPNDKSKWLDTDNDGVEDSDDDFPLDPSQQTDSDGDGSGDNPTGVGADKFPNDSTQWSDIDGDSYGDNPNGTNPDAFITDSTQWSDADGDGYGDNPTGRLYDQFPQNPTQWVDDDGDGLGDNLNGTDADPYLNDFDNDGYNDSIDILPKLPSPGDLDADGCLDEDDAFPSNSQECLDNDGDGEGDNADVDDDNDGWADTDEIRLGTDPFNSAEEPVESFEIVIPGTSVGLGAWDLIGMFGGIPLFVWIGFGFVTRNTRCAKYEAMLREANTRDELESVAYKWEYSLMLRMLGPHQGIRLERLRAELDDKFEAMDQPLSSIENHEFDQTQMVVEEMNDTEKQVPELVTQSDYPSIEDTAQKTDENGYEWFTAQDGTNFYRTIGSQADWIKLEN
jgi:hypothetical protein